MQRRVVRGVVAGGSRAFGRVGLGVAIGLVFAMLALALYAWAAPVVGNLRFDPPRAALGVPTTVRVTVDIPDPSVIPSSVFLQRVNSAGAVVATLGMMNDAGQGGDAAAGDGVYTLAIVVIETAPVSLRVSAAFRGQLRRVNSAVAVLGVARPPVADAGPSFEVAVGTEAAPSGRASTDPDGDAPRFAWRWVNRPAGSTAELHDAAAVQPYFVADLEGEYVLELEVSSGGLTSAPSRVTIRAEAPNAAPRADAGPDQEVPAGARAQLTSDGSTDPESANLTRRWELLEAPPGASPLLDDAASPTPSFEATAAGRYRWRVTVSDGTRESSDEVAVVAYSGNTPPTAVTGPDQEVEVGQRVVLDLRGSFDSDPGDSVMLAQARFVARPAGSQAAFDPPAAPANLEPSFTADLAGDYLVEVRVQDGRGTLGLPRRVLVQAGGRALRKPYVTRLQPASARAGSGAFTLVAEGARFAAGASIVFGNTVLATTVISAKRVQAQVPAAPIASPGAVDVLVRNPAPAGGDSNRVSFVVEAAAPTLNLVTPARLEIGRAQTLALAGANFTPAARVFFGAAELATTFGSSISLSATVPAALLTAPAVVPVSVLDATGRSNTLDVEVGATLAINSVAPSEGPPGTLITIDGSGFGPAAADTQVFVGNVRAGLVIASATRITATVSLLADTGPVRVSSRLGSVSGPVFTVRREQDFNFVASPASVTTVPGAGIGVALQLGSTGVKPFLGVATLALGAAPAGISASFGSPALSAGQASNAILSVPATTAAGTYPVELQAKAAIDGALVTRTATVNLVVQGSAGLTGVRGRFIDEKGRGLAGVIVRAELPTPGASGIADVITDAGGNFLLTGLPAGEVTLRFDATPAGPGYTIWPQAVWLEAGKISQFADWTLRPRPSDDRFTFITPGAAVDQVIANPDIPGLSINIPAGTTIMGWDGVVRTRASVFRVAPDKLPTEAPIGGSNAYYMISFGAPMGGIPVGGTGKIPVTAPNTLGLDPGDKADLYYYYGIPNGGSGGWRKAGSGTVSADGKTVTTDDGVGIDRFCGVCGIWCFIAPPGPPKKCCKPDGAPNEDGNPVDLATGVEFARSVDLSIDGVQPITISRHYHPWDTFIRNANLVPSFGHGWTFGYDHLIYTVSGVTRLVFSGNSPVDLTPDGTGALVAPSDARLRGARLISQASGYELQFKDGRHWRFEGFGFIHLLTQQIDASGNRLVIQRNSSGRPTAITAPGRSVSIGTGSSGFIEVVRDEAGREVNYSYSSGRRLESVRAADGGVTSYTYRVPTARLRFSGSSGVSGSGGGGGSATVSLAEGQGPAPSSNGPAYIETIRYPGDARNVSNTYSNNNRVIRQDIGGAVSLRFSYELSGACALKNPAVAGDLYLVTSCEGPGAPKEESYENFQAGWRFLGGTVIATRVTDGNGNSYKVKFNNNLSEVVDALGQTTVYERDALGRLTLMTDAFGRTTRYEYDGIGNRTAIVDPGGRRTEIAYHPRWNKPVSVTLRLEDGSAVTYRFQYADIGSNPDGRLLSVTDPLNNVTRYAHTDTATARALVERITDPLEHATSLAYNDRGDLASVTNALNHRTDFARDAVGRMLGLTDPTDATTTSTYNAVDQVAQVTDALGGVTRFDYDVKRAPLRVVDARGNAVESYDTDAMNRLTKRIDALGGGETFEYDPGGRLRLSVDRKGQATAYEYDTLDRLVAIRRSDGNDELRSYDPVGRLERIQDAAGVITYDYDVLDRVVKETTDTGGLVNSVEYAYDALDRRVRRTVNGADPATYTYDAASRLSGIGFRGRTVGYEWDAAGRLLVKTLTNGIRQEYSHDEANRLTEIRYRRPDGTLLDSIAYGYDDAGRRVSRTMGFPTNVDSPITGAYDTANRMTSVTFTATGETCALSYDANGSLVRKDCPVSGVTSYRYDARNKLVGLSGPGVEASYRYDALGRRVQRVINGEAVGYLYDGVQAVVEYGAREGVWLTGLVIDEMLARFAGNGEERGVLADAIGSIVGRTTGSSLDIETTGFSPFGLVAETATSDASIGFTGREHDPNGLMHFRFRYLDSDLKRFTSADPIGIQGGMNTYEYAMSRPTSYGDPFGLYPFDIVLEVLSGPWARKVGDVFGAIKVLKSIGSRDLPFEAATFGLDLYLQHVLKALPAANLLWVGQVVTEIVKFYVGIEGKIEYCNLAAERRLGEQKQKKFEREFRALNDAPYLGDKAFREALQDLYRKYGVNL